MKKIILILILASFYIIGYAQNTETKKSEQAAINNIKSESKIKVYPNPCKLEKVTIESNVNDISEIIITNIAGKQIFKKEYPFPETKSEIELSDVPNGIYLVKIRTEDNKIVAKKLIVTKE